MAITQETADDPTIEPELFNLTREELIDTIIELRDENETNEHRIVAQDRLNYVLLQATTAYQIRMVDQELAIQELSDLVEEQRIKIVDLMEA